jgi:hypothetical protein
MIDSEVKLIAARAAAVVKPMLKASIANQFVGGLSSFWRSTGPTPVQGVLPTAWALCNAATVGAIAVPPVVGVNTLYVDEFALVCTTAGVLMLVDRVGASGNLNGTLTTVQAVNTQAVALPSRAPESDLFWALEWYADTGVTVANATCNVTYTDATTGTVVVALAPTMRASRVLPIVPTIAKRIQSIQSVTLSVSTGTAGNFGVSAYKLQGLNANIPVANLGDGKDSLVRAVASDACLVYLMHCTTTGTGDLRGHLTMMEG